MLVRFLAAFVALTGLAHSPATAGILGDAPDAIVCPFTAMGGLPSGLSVFYIDARGDEGTLLYKSLGMASIQLIVEPDGVIEAGNISECSGKSLQELRDAGRAFDFR